MAEQAKGGASLHPISSPDPEVVAALEKHYGPNRSSSTPEPRRSNPDSIRKDLGSNLDDSLFETGGSKRHIAPMPTQGMSILHAERHQRQEVTRRHFEEEKNRFEGARIAEMDRMNEEFEALSHRLVQLRNRNEDLEGATMEKQNRLDTTKAELEHMENQFAHQQNVLRRRTGSLEQRQDKTIHDSDELHDTIREATKAMMDEKDRLIREVEDLQKKHPVTVYSHYQDYIRRLADGEEDAFVGEKPLRFGITSGTTGTGKLIPVVPSQPQMTDLVIFKSWHCHGYGEFGAPSPVQKHLVLYCKPKVTVTKSGLSVTPLIYFPEESRFICDVLFTSPFDGFRIMSDYESTYIHMLFGIRDKHIGTFTAPFLSQVYRAFKLLEGNWEIMLDDLTDGRLGDHLNIDEDIRKALNAKLKPMPERAAELRSEFTQGFEGIMGRMWPNIKFINSIDIAGFQKKLLRYSKGTWLITLLTSSTKLAVFELIVC